MNLVGYYSRGVPREARVGLCATSPATHLLTRFGLFASIPHAKGTSQQQNVTSFMDVHEPEVRSYNMSRIRSKDTKPEMVVRKFLFSKGFRFRLHVKDL